MERSQSTRGAAELYHCNAEHSRPRYGTDNWALFVLRTRRLLTRCLS